MSSGEEGHCDSQSRSGGFVLGLGPSTLLKKRRELTTGKLKNSREESYG